MAFPTSKFQLNDVVVQVDYDSGRCFMGTGTVIQLTSTSVAVKFPKGATYVSEQGPSKTLTETMHWWIAPENLKLHTRPDEKPTAFDDGLDNWDEEVPKT